MRLSGKNKFYAAKDQSFWFQHYFSLLSAEFRRDWSLFVRVIGFLGISEVASAPGVAAAQLLGIPTNS